MKIVCACNCGEMIEAVDRWGRARRYVKGHNPRKGADGFWANVEQRGGPDACWPWKRTRNPKGYGMVKHGRWMRGAHVRAFELSEGRLVTKGLQVLHSCPGGDNPACCNPKHLREGTHAENMSDRGMRGRTARGARSGAARHPEAMSRRKAA